MPHVEPCALFSFQIFDVKKDEGFCINVGVGPGGTTSMLAYICTQQQ